MSAYDPKRTSLRAWWALVSNRGAFVCWRCSSAREEFVRLFTGNSLGSPTLQVLTPSGY
jgi:hypothetical protein